MISVSNGHPRSIPFRRRNDDVERVGQISDAKFDELAKLLNV